MFIKKEKFEKIFTNSKDNFSGYSLPSWDELPDLPLYMDQVLSIMNKYLNIYYATVGEGKGITSSMVNNYVKLKIIPAPIKKRYTKIHLSYLLMICTMKQTLDMATIQKIIPYDLSQEETKKLYNSFVNNQKKAFLYVTENINTIALPLIENEGENQDRLNDLLLQVTSSANIFKLLTEQITKLSNE